MKQKKFSKPKTLFCLIITPIFCLILAGKTSRALESRGLIISEIMPNPDAVADSKGEWIEIYNNSANPINLKGLELSNQSKESSIEEDLVLESKDFVVLCKNKDQEANGGIDCAYQWKSLNLSNQGGFILLSDGQAEIKLEYDSSDVATGKSLEVCSFEAPQIYSMDNLETSTQQMPSGDFGTPGEKSSCSPADSEKNDENDNNHNLINGLILSEILPNPEGADNDENEFIEILNTSQFEIDLKNIYIVNNENKEFVPQKIIKPGEHLVFYKKDFRFSLRNSNDRIGLYTKSEQLIDEMEYVDAESGLSLNKNSENEKVYWSKKPSPGAPNAIEEAEAEQSSSQSTEEREETGAGRSRKKIKNLEDFKKLNKDEEVEVSGIVLNRSHLLDNNRFYLGINNNGIIIEPELDFIYYPGETLKIKGYFHIKSYQGYIKALEIKKVKTGQLVEKQIQELNKESFVSQRGNLIGLWGRYLKKISSYYYFESRHKIIKIEVPDQNLLKEVNLKEKSDYYLTGIIEIDRNGLKIILTDNLRAAQGEDVEKKEAETINLIQKPNHPLYLQKVKIFYRQAD
ncbi:MAG: hypothetical protein GF347_04630 [Candidatus Moranbacteria bacterium]|nr:hypothetical protein [Candidatus Moranbacteria bacterium]